MFSTKEKGVLHLCVHGGEFHLDDVFCCYIMSSLYGERCNNKVVIHRTVNTGDELKKEIENYDFVMDTGMEYDHSKRHYDHHQKDYYETYGTKPIKMAASGLIWRHYGIEIVKTLIKDLKDFDYELTDKEIKLITDKIYDLFVLLVDAKDNGINMFSEPITQTPTYTDYTTLDNVVLSFNKKWFEKLSYDQVLDRFKKSMFIVGEYFTNIFKETVYSIQAQKILDKIYVERFKYRTDGRVLVLGNSNIPVDIHLLNSKANPKILYTIKYSEERKQYSITASNVSRDSFKTILPFPKEW